MAGARRELGLSLFSLIHHPEIAKLISKTVNPKMTDYWCVSDFTKYLGEIGLSGDLGQLTPRNTASHHHRAITASPKSPNLFRRSFNLHWAARVDCGCNASRPPTDTGHSPRRPPP